MVHSKMMLDGHDNTGGADAICKSTESNVKKNTSIFYRTFISYFLFF